MKINVVLVIVVLLLSILIGVSIHRGMAKNDSLAEQGEAEILIGYSMDTLKDARWQKDRDFFVDRANQLGAKVLVQSANGDDRRQIQDVEALISRGVKTLVIIAHNGKAMAKAVRMAHDAGIKVIAYDRIISDCDLDLYMAFDNVEIGRMQARYLVKNLKSSETVKIARIYGSKTDHCAFLYKDGQDEVLKPYLENKSIEVIHEDWTEDWKPENAKKIINAAITNYGPNFHGILASNDGTAGGAIQALKEEGISGVLVTGQDADLVACQRIVAGTQAMTVYLPIKKLAEATAETAVKMAKGQTIIANSVENNGKIDVPSILLAAVTVSKENMKETVIADKYHSYEDIYSHQENK